MRYGPMDQQRVGSPMQGRGLGVRHAGGGAVNNGKKSQGPSSGFLMAPNSSSRMQIGGMQPNPGALSPQQPQSRKGK